MKLAFNTFCCPTWTIDEILAVAVETGYQGVEFRCDADHEHGVEAWLSRDDRFAIRDAFEGAGVQICCIATNLQFYTDAMRDMVEVRAELAQDLGCRGIRVFCGPKPEGLNQRDLFQLVTRNLREAVELVADTAVELWLHTHDNVSLGRDAAEIVRAVGHPRLGILYDNLHPYRKGEQYDATMATLSGMIRHIHFHDGLNRPDQVVIKPMYTGELPVDDMFRAIVNEGYDDFICGEWFHSQYGDAPDLALAAYHKEMTELAARHGITFRKNV